VRVLNEREYHRALTAKLVEEAHEAQLAPLDRLPVELADVLEVLLALARASSLSWDRLAELTEDKRAERAASMTGCFLSNRTTRLGH